jgi:hypothetical protein
MLALTLSWSLLSPYTRQAISGKDGFLKPTPLPGPMHASFCAALAGLYDEEARDSETSAVGSQESVGRYREPARFK